MDRIGEYTVVRLLGSGGMGSVHLARSLSGRLVAIKVIRPEFAADPQFRERFRQEIEAARKVGGFHTAAVVDADADAPQPWMASAYVEGPTLQAEIAQRGPLSEGQLWRLAAALAEALKAIHSHGLVHRDLKPANIVLASDGPRVLDFGIARALEESRLTVDGMVVGTAGYLSPEQALGHPVTGASDVFALGAVLVAACGGSAFGYGSAAGLMYRVVHEDPDVSAVPPSLRSVVLACLRKEPSHRPSPIELLDLCAAHTGATLTHDDTVLGDAPPPPSPLPSSLPHPPQPSLAVTAEDSAPPVAVYRVRVSTWLLQILRNALGVAGLTGGAVLSSTDSIPVAVPISAGIAAFLLGMRLLGLLGTAKDGLSLSGRGIGLGPPNNLVVMPWHEIKALELTRRTGSTTELTVRLGVVRALPIGSLHPSWVRSGRGVIRIRTRRLTPLSTAPQLPDAVHTFAGWQRIPVIED
ncbi:serine/threonine protein kinase [Streptomyces sp. PanSC19]|uniref:serine/threonine-protein kinase n=1 Tax=Streptomyces sp. PanSC19 TaxID=1520455 RepID=UPI000F48A076|nr:serine/threonine-protein kinase [Streptomyces sp. PanSC19]ROQ23523.1 serine/threonine protein kinase [Streptomyces sp. PanSC19]